MREHPSQWEIWKWQTKNNRWINTVLAGVFLAGIPILGAVFSIGIQVDDYSMAYGYVLFIEKTILAMLGIVPLLLSMHGAYHSALGDCLALCPSWKEGRQCLLNYAVSALVLFAATAFLIIIYHEGVQLSDFLRDLADLLIVLWVLYTVTHLLVRTFGNVYFALILIEFYSIVFWLIGIGQSWMWNVFSIDTADGLVWLIRMVMYASLGLMLEEIIPLIQKSGKWKKS